MLFSPNLLSVSRKQLGQVITQEEACLCEAHCGHSKSFSGLSINVSFSKQHALELKIGGCKAFQASPYRRLRDALRSDLVN